MQSCDTTQPTDSGSATVKLNGNHNNNYCLIQILIACVLLYVVGALSDGVHQIEEGSTPSITITTKSKGQFNLVTNNHSAFLVQVFPVLSV